jgi:hypothetical protein
MAGLAWLDTLLYKTSLVLWTHRTCSIHVSLLTRDDGPSGKPRPPGAPRPAGLAAPTACAAVQPPRPARPVPGGAQLLPQEAVAGEGAEDARRRTSMSPACNGREGELLPRAGHCWLLGVHQEIVLPAWWWSQGCLLLARQRRPCEIPTVLQTRRECYTVVASVFVYIQ